MKGEGPSWMALFLFMRENERLCVDFTFYERLQAFMRICGDLCVNNWRYAGFAGFLRE
ncbi:hypothetical protein [Sporosarcina koreensis]|uniref:Uncharacterized protein n=1 Tax=Sporosarcina koreensis TaxID=334735 RepID=A0ABW0U0W8_9BACL